MTGERVGVIAAAGLVAFLLIVVSSSGPVTYIERFPEFSLDFLQPDGQTFEIGNGELDENENFFKIWEIDLPDILATLLELLLIAAGVWLLVKIWQRRPRLRWRRPKPDDGFEVLDDLAELLSEDRAKQHAVLAAGAPRNAIVECWMRLEAVSRAAGHEHDPSDTAAESTAKLLRTFTVDEAAVERLADLYREARFSSHEMTEAQRSDAMRSLDAIHDGLAAQLVS